MNRFPIVLALACCVISHGINAEDDLGKGKLLVATEFVQGRAFAESVILLLNYDETGAVGLVLNVNQIFATAKSKEVRIACISPV